MKFVLAPDSYKESLHAIEVCNAMEAGIKQVISNVEITKVPIADGGEGTVDAILTSVGGKKKTVPVTGPLGNQVDGCFGLIDDESTAIIELAAASGLHLVPVANRNPLVTTSKGTGELIQAALDHGVKKVIIGIGGSATNDGGVGMLQALGVSFLNKNGDEIGYGGKELKRIDKIDTSRMDQRLRKVQFIVACDVDNPLVGKNGASVIYGPQKGATQKMVEELDDNLTHYGKVIKKQMKKNVMDYPGSGAAGGVGAGLLAFLGATLQSGIEVISEITGLECLIQSADVVFTGEGKLDGQTFHGKAPIGVASLAKRYNKPVIAIAGILGEGYESLASKGITAAFSIVPGPVPIESAKEHAFDYVKNTTENIIKVLQINRSIS